MYFLLLEENKNRKHNFETTIIFAFLIFHDNNTDQTACSLLVSVNKLKVILVISISKVVLVNSYIVVLLYSKSPYLVALHVVLNQMSLKQH